MNAVAKVVEQPPVVAEGATLLAVISRAASDPQTDVEKMERLMAMYERVEAKRAEAAFAEALSAMQSELPAIGERGKAKVNGEVRYTFALWEDINTAIKPVLQKFGFALSFRTDFTDGIAITGVLSHRAGHSERTTIKLPADASGSKNAVQAVASSVSYGKRYTAGALLNLTSHGEDDDAYSTEPGYDPADWYSAIDGAADMTELSRVGDDLKGAKASIPAPALRSIRAAWAKRAKELA